MAFHVKFTTAGDDYEAVLGRVEAEAWLELIKWPGPAASGLEPGPLANLDNAALGVALAAGTAAWVEGRAGPFIRVETPTVDEPGVAVIRVASLTGFRVWWDDEVDSDQGDGDEEDATQALIDAAQNLPATGWIQ